jgi:hypothetical protein
MLPAAGIAPESADDMRRIAQATEKLRHVNGNAAILFHTGEYTQAQTLDYMLTYGLATQARAERSFRFITNPLFRAYAFTYTEGYDLLQRAGGDKRTLFKKLLTEQMLPSQLAAQQRRV